MWRKVSPIAFRIPYIKKWKSVWYQDPKDYKQSLQLDMKARAILKQELKWIPMWDIVCSKEQENLRIALYTAKAALILGKTGEQKDQLEEKLTRKLWVKVLLEVKEIKKPDLSAQIIWFMVANQIEKRMPYKRAIKQAIGKAMEKWAKWIKIKIGWRLNGAEIARKETFKEGSVSTQTIRSDIDYTSIRAETVYGTLWIKVWVYHWEVYKK